MPDCRRLRGREEVAASEKKVARRAFDAALDAALAGAMAEFKRRAAAVKTLDEMWAMEDYLRRQRRQIDETFDYRYLQLLFVFAQPSGIRRLRLADRGPIQQA